MELDNFVVEYLKKYPQPIAEDGPLPMRLQAVTFSQSDLEAECLDLVLQHLKLCSCPNVFACYVARKVTKEILNKDMTSYAKETPLENSIQTKYDATAVSRITLIGVHDFMSNWKERPNDFPQKQKYPICSECGIRNTRRKMEDKHSVFPNFNILMDLKDFPETQFYAVYDGHGGLDASIFASKHLQFKLLKQNGFPEDIPGALKSSILEVDNEFCERAKSERLRSGTTAVVSLIYKQELHVAWLGDSQGVLVRDGTVINFMNPHKPEREDEKLRIEEMGGCVVWFGAWRVNGSLSVSRAIGDADHKPYVCGDADTATLPLDGSEDYLCLACDGFWDVYNGEDLVRLVREHLQETNDKSTVARYLCTKAKENGSTDNITVIVVFLRENINMEIKTNMPVEVVVDIAKVNIKDVDKKENSPKLSPLKNEETANKNTNNNNTSQSDGLVLVQGFKVEPSEKQKIPHKQLLNFVKGPPKKNEIKDQVVVRDSYPHTKLPQSLRKPRWSTNSQLQRKSTKESLLSISTIADLHYENKNNENVPLQLPSINNNYQNNESQYDRSSLHSLQFDKKLLGHRAPVAQSRGRQKIPYRASIVVNCHANPPAHYKRHYSRSIPGDLNNFSINNGAISGFSEDRNKTDIAITNSLMSSIKPLSKKKTVPNLNKRTTKLIYIGRQRSRSAF